MANATLQSFNVFLTERLTAAAVDIYGFVERTIIDYQDEVYRTKLENQRLQRLLDLVYKPEIRLHRADARQIDLPTPAQEVCDLEHQIHSECIPRRKDEEEEKPAALPLKEERTEALTMSEEIPLCPQYGNITDSFTKVNMGEYEHNVLEDDLTVAVTVGEHDNYQVLDDLTRVVTVGEHFQDVTPPHPNQPVPSISETTSYTRKKHIFSSHSTKPDSRFKRRMFTCFVCGKTADTISNMTAHMKSHNTEKPYVCLICGKNYKLKSHLKEHARTHTGERPFTCYICGQAFNRSSTMSKHARNMHSENKAFRCTQCGQCFSLLVVMKRHMRMIHGVLCPA